MGQPCCPHPGTGKTTFIRMMAGLLKPDSGGEIPRLHVSYKPQKISPKFQGTVRQLLHTKIRDSYVHPQFVTDVMKPLQMDSIIDQEVSHEDRSPSSLLPPHPSLVTTCVASRYPTHRSRTCREESCNEWLSHLPSVNLQTSISLMNHQPISTRSSELLQHASSSASSYMQRRQPLWLNTTSSWPHTWPTGLWFLRVLPRSRRSPTLPPPFSLA